VDLGHVLARAGGRSSEHAKRRDDGGWVVEAVEGTDKIEWIRVALKF